MTAPGITIRPEIGNHYTAFISAGDGVSVIRAELVAADHADALLQASAVRDRVFWAWRRMAVNRLYRTAYRENWRRLRLLFSSRSGSRIFADALSGEAWR